MPSAISFTRGLAIRNDSVTPIGTPAATNPMKAGTALQEQKGVATPSPAATTLAKPSRLPPSSALVRSRLMKDRSTVTTKMIPGEEQQDLRGVEDEEVDRLAEAFLGSECCDVVHDPVPERPVDPVQEPPERHRGDEAAPQPQVGGGPALFDPRAHGSTGPISRSNSSRNRATPRGSMR